MSLAPALAVADPTPAGEAVPAGVRLLGLVQRMMRTGLAMARCVGQIARHRLAGQELAAIAPAGFDPTMTNALVVMAVAWTAALRERLRMLVAPASFVPAGASVAERGPRGHGTAHYLPEGFEPAPGEWHDWRDLAKPWRVGPGSLAVAQRAIARLSDAEVVAQICSNLQRAATALGAEADVERIAALETAARALCPEETVLADADGDAAEPGGGARVAAGAWAAPSPASAPEAWAGRDPPPPPPD